MHDLIAESLNNIFAEHEYINVAHGLLTALQKAGKPKAYQKYSSSNLLNNATDSHLKYCVNQNSTPTVEEYLSHSQSAETRHGRNESNIVWCHIFLAARVQKFQEEIMITGIDMTSAFDTIKRTKLIEILESSSNISNPFDTNIGSPKGDGLSGCLFIIYLEKALRTLRDRVDNNHVTG